MSLRALKGRGNPPLRAQRGNLILERRDRTACSEQSEGIFFAPREDTGIIAFVLVEKKAADFYDFCEVESVGQRDI